MHAYFAPALAGLVGELFAQLLQYFFLVPAQVNAVCGVIGYEGDGILLKSSDPAVSRDIRRQTTARAGSHRFQQFNPAQEFGGQIGRRCANSF